MAVLSPERLPARLLNASAEPRDRLGWLLVRLRIVFGGPQAKAPGTPGPSGEKEAYFEGPFLIRSVTVTDGMKTALEQPASGPVSSALLRLRMHARDTPWHEHVRNFCFKPVDDF